MKLTYTQHDTFCNVCGVSKGSKRWKEQWHDYNYDKIHICPSCYNIAVATLAIEEFKREQSLVFKMRSYEEIKEEVLCRRVLQAEGDTRSGYAREWIEECRNARDQLQAILQQAGIWLDEESTCE